MIKQKPSTTSIAENVEDERRREIVYLKLYYLVKEFVRRDISKVVEESLKKGTKS